MFYSQSMLKHFHTYSLQKKVTSLSHLLNNFPFLQCNYIRFSLEVTWHEKNCSRTSSGIHHKHTSQDFHLLLSVLKLSLHKKIRTQNAKVLMPSFRSPVSALQLSVRHLSFPRSFLSSCQLPRSFPIFSSGRSFYSFGEQFHVLIGDN